MPDFKHTVGLSALVWAAMIPFGAVANAAAQATVRVPLDSERTINGVGVACTGIGSRVRDAPRWTAYPVRVEFADAEHAYLAGEVVTLSSENGSALLTVRCAGPWVLFKLPDRAAYRVDARVTEKGVKGQSAMVRAPENGQTRYVLTFPKGY